jgi:hypothetical protein
MSRIFACAALLIATLALAAPAPPAQPLLPHAFAGWAQSTAAPSAAPDGANAAVLHEYGLQQSATANYGSGSNRLSVRAWRFGDATGAYGAFTFYRQPAMHDANIGHGGASSAEHYLFWTGTTVVDAAFAHPSAAENAAITALAADIPQSPGPEGIPPSLPHYLPAAGLDLSTVRYAIGPAAYAQMGGVLPPNLIDFGQDAEAVTANYGPTAASATLTLLIYPTPQIAGSHLQAIDQLGKSSGLTTKRIGPLVAVVSGKVPASKAQQLLDQIRFNDYVTINHPEGYVSESAKVARLLLGIATLTGVLIGAALLLAIFLGGGRALVRLMRGKPASSVSEEEFISLHLS